MRNDLSIYSKFAHEWWQEDGFHFRSLQNLTPFRLSLISEAMGNLKDKVVLDLGCGGGLIAVPLLNQGAKVIGIDLSAESITVATEAARGRGRFMVGDARFLNIPSDSVDCVLIVDVLDHIPHFGQVLREASRVLKSSGKLYVGTLNRTWMAHIMTITFGETFGFIPRGTHDSRLFIKPNELIDTARLFGLSHLSTQGESPMIFRTLKEGAISLRKSSSPAIAYSAVFQREPDA